jgi:hypothetical protein
MAYGYRDAVYLLLKIRVAFLLKRDKPFGFWHQFVTVSGIDCR